MPLAVPPQLHRGPSSASANQAHRIRLVPHLDSRRTLRFEPITRDLKDDDPPLRIGRFTDRSGIGLNAANLLSSNKLAFKSKVVSRSHAEIWLDAGKFFIRDTKSSSGTFLNHLRLSPAGQESRPYQLRDGDVLQLGVDYQGGSEDIYKSVKIKIEVGREWQAGANAFKCVSRPLVLSLVDLSAAHTPSANSRPSPSPIKTHPRANNVPQRPTFQTVAYVRLVFLALSPSSFSLGLFSVTIRQALFIAPCSHAFHYKCIRPLLEKHASAFSCPLCRSFADLDEDVEVEHEPEPEDEDIDWEDVGGAPSASHILPAISARQLASPPPLARDGAETEVEGDLVGNDHRVRRSRPSVRTDGHIAIPPMDPVVDLDAEMHDLEEGDDEGVLDGSSQSHDQPAMGFVTRGPGFGLPLPGNSSGAHDEADGRAEVVLTGVLAAEPVMSGKRKR